MKDKPTIEEVKIAIAIWADMVAHGQEYRETILKYLNQGFCINIQHVDYLKLNQITPTPEYVHAYPAIFELADGSNCLEFVLIDSTSDAELQSDLSHIVVKDFLCGESAIDTHGRIDHNYRNSIPTPEAILRNFIWKMFCNEWLEAILNNSEESIFKAIRIPFTDLQQLFPPDILDSSSDNIPSAIAFLGLTNQPIDPHNPDHYKIEFILTNEHLHFMPPVTLFDISRPVPPFDSPTEHNEFKLMVTID